MQFVINLKAILFLKILKMKNHAKKKLKKLLKNMNLIKKTIQKLKEVNIDRQ